MAKQKKRPVRIKDIADKAGVSTGTVDRVLHGRGRVSQENEKKVRDAIEILAYEPNLMARSLAINKSFEIAIVIPDFSKDSFWKAQKNGIERALKYIQDFGFSIKILKYDDQKKGDLLRYKKLILEENYDAILLGPTVTDDAHNLLDYFCDIKMPYLLINSNLERSDDYFIGYVGQDSLQSGKLAARLLSLMTAGDGDLSILHMEKEIEISQHLLQKQKGFIHFFETSTKSYPKIAINRVPDFSNKKILKNTISKLLEDSPQLQGIFVTTSRLHYLIEVLQEINRDDIMVVGFDIIQENIAAINKYENAILIDQNPERQGYSGLISLFEYLLNNKEIKKVQYLPLNVLTRENLSTYIDTLTFKHIF